MQSGKSKEVPGLAGHPIVLSRELIEIGAYLEPHRNRRNIIVSVALIGEINQLDRKSVV